MGSPTIFSGRYTKLLTNKGILNSDGSLNQYDGPVNYVKYAEFEQNVTTGWSLGTTGTLTNAIPTGTPAFGSGASGNLSIATSNVSPIRDNISLRYVSSAATTAGNMLATNALTIDAADQARVLTFKFYYSVVSNPTNGNFSGTSSNSFGVAVWDVTNSAWIGVAGNFSMTQNSGVGIASGTFQTNSNTSQIRLVIYNANATSGAITLAFDDFFVGPQTAPIGPVVTDWVSYTPTGTWTTNTTYTGRWRRVGDSMEVQFGIALTGAPNATGLSVNLPSGYSVDTSKLPTGSLMDVAGSGQGLKGGTGYILGSYLATVTSVQISFIVNGASPAENNLSNTAPVSWANGDIINGSFRVPISGWSSNVQLSNDTDTRVVAFAANKTAAQSIPNNSYTVIDFNSVEINTHGSTYAAGAYTAPVSGYYRVGFNFNFASGSGGTIFALLNKNGAGFSRVSTQPFATSQSGGTGTTVLYLNAGDNVSLSVIQLSGAAQNLEGAGRFSVERISGPSVVAANESVNANYFTTSTGAMAVGTPAVVVFGTKSFDSHNAYNSTTGIYTVPVSGKYQVNTTITSTSTSQIQSLVLDIMKNGSTWNRFTPSRLAAVGSALSAINSAIVAVNAGDTIEIRCSMTSGTGNFDGNAFGNNFTIARVGN